ncbi:PIN domain-containing protein [Mycobacterium sp.]|uniref:PIN domain-containing protein n=1 Tax=Mycobacterium sp. TaxID=1785 RepID=UPI003A88C7C0
MSAELLLDNSAFVRLATPTLPDERSREIADAIEQRRVAVCLPFLLEAGYCVRTAADHDELLRELLVLPMLHIDPETEGRAVDAQHQLARAGHHRLPPVDLIIAALADRHGVGVLHYDHDYDTLATRTDLRFSSVWLAGRGTL